MNPDVLIVAEHYGDPGPWLEGDEWDTVMNYDDYMVDKNKNEIVIGDPDEGGNILQLFEYKDYSIN